MEAEARDDYPRCTRRPPGARLTLDAEVIAADEVQLHVRCPHCLEVHHHGAGGLLGYRTPHCRTWPLPPDYRLTDPAGLVR